MTWSDCLATYPGAGVFIGLDDPDKEAAEDPYAVVDEVVAGVTRRLMTYGDNDAEDFLRGSGGKGDCQTLCIACAILLEYLGIECSPEYSSRLLVGATRALPGRSHSNVYTGPRDSGLYYFDQHQYFSFGGATYDPLLTWVLGFTSAEEGEWSTGGRDHYFFRELGMTLYSANDPHYALTVHPSGDTRDAPEDGEGDCRFCVLF